MKETGWLQDARFAVDRPSDTSVAIPVGRAEGGGYPIRVRRRGTVEFVQVRVVFRGLALSEAAIELRSPAGTRSVLLTPYTPGIDYPDAIDLVLASNAFLSEPMQGDWTLRVVDARGELPQSAHAVDSSSTDSTSEADRLPGPPQMNRWSIRVMGS